MLTVAVCRVFFDAKFRAAMSSDALLAGAQGRRRRRTDRYRHDFDRGRKDVAHGIAEEKNEHGTDEHLRERGALDLFPIDDRFPVRVTLRFARSGIDHKVRRVLLVRFLVLPSSTSIITSRPSSASSPTSADSNLRVLRDFAARRGIFVECP